MTKIINTTFDELIDSLAKINTDLLLIVIDCDVFNRYKKKIIFEKLKNLNKKYFIWPTPSGEDVKNLKQYEICIDYFLNKGVHRNAHLVAIGGGAISDFGGFVASTLLRGISWSIVPTTLLSFVDASIGGKVGLNTRNAKNQIGAFHFPENIYNIFEFLETLPKVEIDSGKGEIIKYAFLDDKIKESLTSSSSKDLSLQQIIELCGDFKSIIVKRDFKESGERKILNLGHTFGHCFERMYRLPHGIAVVWGMIYLFFLLNKGELIQDTLLYCSKLNLTLEAPPWLDKNLSVDDMLELLKKDKKISHNNQIDLIVVNNHKAEIKRYQIEELTKLIKEKSNEFTKTRF